MNSKKVEAHYQTMLQKKQIENNVLYKEMRIQDLEERLNRIEVKLDVLLKLQNS